MRCPPLRLIGYLNLLARAGGDHLCLDNNIGGAIAGGARVLQFGPTVELFNIVRRSACRVALLLGRLAGPARLGAATSCARWHSQRGRLDNRTGRC